MSLKAQLLLFGLLTLALPWAGFEFVAQMEGALRQGLEQSLRASAGTAATVLGNDPGIGWPDAGDGGEVIYAHRLDSAPRVDGYRNDWRFVRQGAAATPSAAFLATADARAWLGIHGRFAYLSVDVDDAALVYPAAPGQAPFGDRVAILAGGAAAGTAAGNGGRAAVLLSTAAPGRFRAAQTAPGRFIPTGDYEDRVLAAWQETRGGYSVEARVPVGMLAGRIGVAVIDVDPAGGGGYEVRVTSTWDDDPARPTRIVAEIGSLDAALGRLGRAGDRYRVIDPDGWVLADSGALDPERLPDELAATPLTERLLRTVLRRNDPQYDGLESPVGRVADPLLRQSLDGTAATAWYRRGPTSEAVVATAVPIASGGRNVAALVLEQASDSVLTLSNEARTRLMLATLLISLVAAVLLFGYASFLSFRIGRLARAAETALGPRGELDTALPGGGARDELGDLSRRFGDLLRRLAAYTDYLRTLTGKLAHEIRTPIAIVSTSVDNLETGAEDPAVVRARLRQGTARLEAILSAMSAATRVEQAVAETPAERYEPYAIVNACVDAYRSVYPDRQFVLDAGEPAFAVFGSGDLLAQLLDKLVENAVGFSAAGSVIRIGLAASADTLELSVANDGPPLPPAMQHQIFDSLVSVRESRDGGTHLGLGLYIVALIAKFHSGTAVAANRPDGGGVVVTVRLPRHAAGD